MKKWISFLILLVPHITQATRGNFDPSKTPQAPNYSDENMWAALPFRKDLCDFSSVHDPYVSDSLKTVDVFFIHPTTYLKGEFWNAPLPDKKIDKDTDEKPIKYQASVFNESCRIYAPRYRQALINSFYDTTNGAKALEVAYADVKDAFEYYLKYYNQGRPFIIASHSQGTFHARRLLSEYIDKKSLANKMVMAYLIGYPVYKGMYESIPVCADTNMTNGIVSWHSFRHDYQPPGLNGFYKNCIVVNPITWRVDTTETDYSQGLGAKGAKLNSRIKDRIKAKIYESILWVTIKYPIIKKKKNLHVFDYNLFWYDMKEDVKRRIRLFKQ